MCVQPLTRIEECGGEDGQDAPMFAPTPTAYQSCLRIWTIDRKLRAT